jgi:hypothetical protein
MNTRLSAIAFDSDIAKLTENFTGRQWVFDDIDRWLKESEERFFILTGEPGVGKSAIAASLIQQRQAHQDLAAYHFCVAGRVGTIEPDNVLFSIAAQLIKFFPDYAEALVNTIKPLHLSVNVEINIETIRDSVVQGVVIENLHTQHPKKSFDIILRQTLSSLPNPPEKSILILIDSLDEAVTYNEEDNLVRLFSQVNDLPSWIRLVFTSRHDERRVLSHFKTLKPYLYHLEKLSKQSLEDIHTYVDERVKRDLVQVQLKKYEVSPLALVKQLTDLSKGNFLYTKVLLDDIESGGQPLDKENLAKLPKSLSEFYHTFLIRRVEAEWEGKYQLIFQVLTVTKAPITEEELANLVNEKLSETELRQRLMVVRQFLDVEKNIWNKQSYTLFHQSLRGYLADSEKNEVFYCSPKDGHEQIVKYYWQYQKDPKSWQDCDVYGLQFFVPHLVDLASLEKPPVNGKQYIETLHELLATEVAGRNAWFIAKDQIGDTAGFLADVKLAWELAERNWTDATLPQVIERQCRYALIFSTLNSLSDIPTELLESLVKVGLPYGWSPENGLAYARRVPDPAKRAKNLAVLIEYLPEEQPAKIWPEVLSAAQAIQDESSRAKVLSALATNLPQELYKEVLSAAQAIQFEYYRADVLSALAANFPSPELYKEALNTAQAIQDESSRAKVLSALAANLPQDLYKGALSAAQAIQSESIRAKVLSALAANFPSPELYKEALSTAQAIQDESSRAYALSALAANFPSPELYKEALSTVQAIQFEFFRAKVLSELATNLPQDLYQEALSAALAIQDESSRAMVLSALTANFPSPELYKEALSTALAIQSESSRAYALSALAANLPQGLHKEALSAAQAIQDEFFRAYALSALAANFPSPELYKEALSTALAIQSESSRTKVLNILIPQSATFPTSQQFTIWQEVLNQGSQRKRPDLLSDLAALVPLIDNLGGKESGVAVAKSIQQVSKWWR